MQISRGRWTVNNLLSIYQTSRTVLYEHLNQNGLKNYLLKNNHITKHGRQTLFDDFAMLRISQTFSNRTVKKSRPRRKQNRMGKRTEKELLRLTRQNTRKLDRISNKMGITY